MRRAARAATPALPPGDLWVFGYGSLMWRPGFVHLERHRARIFGFHRSLCVWSWFHRGRRESPGLVFGLDAGGSCVGLAYRVAARDKRATSRYLYRREMVTPVYQPQLVTAHVAGRRVHALTFAVDRAHPQYAGRLDHEQTLRVVRGAHGQSGPNHEYVLSTAGMLERLALRDPALAALAASLQQAEHPARAAPRGLRGHHR